MNKMGELRLLLFFFQNGILSLTNSPSLDVNFITTEGDLVQEYSCFISPGGGDRDCVSRAVDLRIRTIPGMHLHLKSSTQLARHSTTIMILTVSVGGRVAIYGPVCPYHNVETTMEY